jgi:hypothetical protein
MKNSEILAAFILVNEKMAAGVEYENIHGNMTYSPYICDNVGNLFGYKSNEYDTLTSIIKARIKGRYCVKSYLKECLGWDYDQIDQVSMRHYRLGMLKEFIETYTAKDN